MKNMILLSLMFLLGCANYFEDYYEGLSVEELNKWGTESLSADIIMKKSSMFRIYQDEDDMWSNNYIKIGSSSFNAGDVNKKDASKFGKKIGADVVILYIQYTDTINTVTPINLPDFTDVNTSYYNSYGGMVGSAKSIIQGTSTTYIPTVVRRYDYLATYWKKNPKEPKVGVICEDLSNEIKQKYKTNKGAVILFIVKGSPAFNNDILKGDVILKINGKDVYDSFSAKEIMDSISDNEVMIFTLMRDGTVIKKSIRK